MRWMTHAAVLAAAIIAGTGYVYSQQRVTRPWSATWSGETAIVGTCNDGTFLLMVDEGIGNADHMGRSTHLTTYCMDPSTWIGSGSGVEAAANGDDSTFSSRFKSPGCRRVTASGGRPRQ